jgi:hypothetical protein
VNLAGVQIILNMREKMDQMQKEFNRFFEYLRDYAARDFFNQNPQAQQALVPTRRLEPQKAQRDKNTQR